MRNDMRGHDIIDVRQLIERAQDLRDAREDEDWDEDGREELLAIEELLDEISGYGHDEIRGITYPTQLISRGYWTKFVQIHASEHFEFDERNASWPANHIDWESAADELEEGFSTCTFDGEEYLYEG